MDDPNADDLVPRLLTIEQVAACCQVSTKTVYRAIRRGALRATRLGRTALSIVELAEHLGHSPAMTLSTYGPRHRRIPRGRPGRPGRLDRRCPRGSRAR